MTAPTQRAADILRERERRPDYLAWIETPEGQGLLEQAARDAATARRMARRMEA